MVLVFFGVCIMFVFVLFAGLFVVCFGDYELWVSCLVWVCGLVVSFGVVIGLLCVSWV